MNFLELQLGELPAKSSIKKSIPILIVKNGIQKHSEWEFLNSKWVKEEVEKIFYEWTKNQISFYNLSIKIRDVSK